ncbi:MAG: HAD-IIB family hydrolase [Arcobacteraceae bacterium]|nr:HAD-IIB family hydrolase [Arcobacteraceae bacterium]
MKNIIFTDLDGTFLNHDNYSFEESKEALKKIEQQKIPLIFTTSKTKIEVELLQKKVGIVEPFIVENGAALFIPKNYQNLNLDFLTDFEEYKVLVFGKTYNQILNFYNEYKEEFGLKGFSDMDNQEISELTGLDASSATLAKQREFTEPFVMEDIKKLEKLKNLASTFKIKITQGGRFFHLIGEKQDKGIAVKKSIELFEKLYDEKINSIALGDGENDIKMLEVVDTPIVIKNHNDEYLSLDLKNLQKSTYQGSSGWNEMIVKNV